MTEEPEFPFDGLDAERPLPPELQARLEAALLAAVAGGLPVPADAGGLHQPPGTRTDSLDAPRPLPETLRARLESALMAEAAVTSAPGADVVPLASRRRKVVAAGSSVAAVLLLVVMVAGLAGRGGDSGSGSLEAAGGPTTTTLETPASLPPDAGASTEEGSTAATAPAAASPTTRATRPRPSPSTTGPQAPDAGGTTPAPTSPAVPMSPEPSGGAPEPASTGPGPAPPFYNSPAPGDSAGGAPAMTSGPPSAASPSEGGSQDAAPGSQPQRSTSPPAGPALRVGIITGDAAQEAGFRAYINRLNQAGGVQGHAIELVTVSAGAPAANTVATVNLSSQPVAGPGGAPGWATGPLLETLTATEDLLTGNGAVFSFASAPERQGHLAAEALFPSEAAAGTKAVIFVPAAPGPLRDAVPAAIKAVLKQRNVTNVQVVTYDPAHKLTPIDADAAFVSLDPAGARAWVAQAKAEGYRPPAGVAGIYSLADDALAADLPEGARVVSPYVAPAGDEGQAIRSAGAGTSASVLHGWATAKSLAAAVWRTGADTAAEVQTALDGLTGWSSGLAPPYETRPGTRSRTPEGVVFQVQSGAFVAQGGFRRDPYPSPIQ